MIISTKQFIADFKQSPYYERVFRNHNIILLFVSGSRASGIIDEKSDFDIVAITDNVTPDDDAPEYLTYKGGKGALVLAAGLLFSLGGQCRHPLYIRCDRRYGIPTYLEPHHYI